MRINNNIQALNTYNRLTINNDALSKSVEKLSSGLRINRAGDDAAGLAISEKMRAQIRGLNQAQRNAQDAISLIQTAEGALNEVHSILQRMRELAVQAANDTNTETDRNEIQKEINQLTSEINRIANTTEFNTMKLLDGSRTITMKTVTSTTSVDKIVNGPGGSLTVNYSFGVTISGDNADWQKAISGGITIGTDPTADEKIDWQHIDLTQSATVKVTKTSNGDLQIDIAATDKGGNAVSYSTLLDADTIKTGADSSGIYKVNFHGVTFNLDVNAFKNVDNNTSVTIDLQNAKGNTSNDADVTGTYGLVHDFTNSTQAANFTKFTIDGKNPALVGAKYIQVGFNGTKITVDVYAADGSTKILSDTYTPATAPSNEGDTFEYEENGINFAFKLIKDPSGNVITSFTTNQLDISNFVAKLTTETTTTTSTVVDKDNSLIMQIGANASQTISVTINDMRASALGVSSAKGGSGFTSTQTVTNGTDNNAIEYALSVLSAADASNAITKIQSAIEAVSAERSKLGAYQNRLEHTINNLGTAAENLTAAESRIRDVDMAKEMMNYTKNNILMQAATAMLAQANQLPQAVLQLLR